MTNEKPTSGATYVLSESGRENLFSQPKEKRKWIGLVKKKKKNRESPEARLDGIAWLHGT